ncbi:MAG: type II toxin-antitoxin system RelE/ParE family toxin [Schwartzia sp.]|nr:type II toxin-antitoxin system RelE/ParE family toxin [Schwartzia sp. (in: firmicutes)]
MKAYKIGISHEAKEHMRRISAYISHQLKAPQAAKNVRSDLRDAMDSLRTMPERIPLSRDALLKKRGLHCMVVRKYLVYFQIDEPAKQVNILAVLYGKRDQGAQMETIVEN